MEQIKIALRNFGVAHERIHGTEASPDAEITSILFLNADDEVFAAGNRRIRWFGSCIHLAKILQAFQTLLADFDLHHIKDIAGADGEFAAQHLILGLEVAVNLNFLHVGNLILANLKIQIHGAVLDVRHGLNAQGLTLGNFDVTFAAVKILYRLGIFLQPIRRKNTCDIHHQTVRAQLGLGVFIFLDGL